MNANNLAILALSSGEICSLYYILHQRDIVYNSDWSIHIVDQLQRSLTTRCCTANLIDNIIVVFYVLFVQINVYVLKQITADTLFIFILYI